MSTMEARRAELERKRQKLEQLRQERIRKKEEKEKKEGRSKEGEDSGRVVRSEHALDADELLSSLGISLPSDSSLTSIGTPATSGTPDTSITASPDPSLVVAANQTPVKVQKKAKLSICTVHQTNIPPKENVTYNKQTQTVPGSSDREAHPLDYYVLTFDDVLAEEDGEGPSSLVSQELVTPPIFPHKVAGLPNVEMVRPAQTPDEGQDQVKEKEAAKEEKHKARELSEEEKKQILLSEDFQNFFDRTSRIVERALYEEFDICIDYTGAGEEQDGDDKSGIKISLNRYFFDDRWSKNRTITSFDWSTQFPELLVASYNNNEDSPHDPDGVCLVWNMKFKKTTPEYIFHCQSPVMTSCFAKFHPNLIIGGTYSGQIVLWDNRSNKRTPVQRSPLSATAHTHPIYCVNVVGTQNAHNLVSVSTDGKFCSWSLDMLSAPQDSMELTQQKQSRAVAVTSLSFPCGDFNNFIVGSEEGAVYTACHHGSKAGIVDIFEGHQGPVTGIHTNCAQGQIDFSHLFLTSSFDWTVKLWSLKENKPIYSFEDNGDYVYDVRWSPIHPALFACVDGMGRLDLWNLNSDTELPTVSEVVDGCPALNRVIWTPNGQQVIVGDDMGKIWVYDVGEQLALPKADEWTKFVHTLQELKNNQADQDLDAMSVGSLPSTGSFGSTSPLR